MTSRYRWNEAKRGRNLAKHGLDFAAAWWVYEAPDKMTIDVIRCGEARRVDVAIVDDGRLVLTFVYTLRGDAVRCISLRLASRNERRMFDEWQSDWQAC